jgi:hypothetical protein
MRRALAFYRGIWGLLVVRYGAQLFSRFYATVLLRRAVRIPRMGNLEVLSTAPATAGFRLKPGSTGYLRH